LAHQRRYNDARMVATTRVHQTLTQLDEALRQGTMSIGRARDLLELISDFVRATLNMVGHSRPSLSAHARFADLETVPG
jgi:hypothetical protein